MRRKPVGERTGRIVDGQHQARYAEPYGGSLRGVMASLVLIAAAPLALASSPNGS